MLGLLAATAPIWLILLLLGWPHLRDILDGRDVVTPHSPDYPNYVRNLFELTSFIATTAVLITALFAFVFTRTQIKEARDTRLAALYATLESRWASDEMLRSKAEFAAISIAYERSRRLAPAGQQPQPLADFAAVYLADLRENDYGKYSSLMSLIEYLEYIGMLEKNEYLSLDDIQFILGTVCIEVYSVMSKHIEEIRRVERERRVRNRLSRAPDEFQCFADLTRKFAERFGDR